MITLHITSDDVANVRFATNPLWEVSAALHAVAFPPTHDLRRQLAKLAALTNARDLGVLLELTQIPGWAPDVLAPVPSAKPLGVEEQLLAVREVSTEVAERDLAVLRSTPNGRLGRLAPEDYLEVVADALLRFWQRSLTNVWDRVQSVQQADLLYRQRVVLADGIASVLGGLHSSVRYESSTVRIDLPRHTCSSAGAGDGLWLVPSVFRWPNVCVAVTDRGPVTISYPARGAATLWEPGKRSDRYLGGLLGRSRAAILEDLDVPRTTTVLAQRLDLAPGTVSAHLSALTSSGLLTAQRAGRRVFYSRTEVAAELISAGTAGGQS